MLFCDPFVQFLEHSELVGGGLLSEGGHQFKRHDVMAFTVRLSKINR